jgi:hypothetical protein
MHRLVVVDHQLVVPLLLVPLEPIDAALAFGLIEVAVQDSSRLSDDLGGLLSNLATDGDQPSNSYDRIRYLN